MILVFLQMLSWVSSKDGKYFWNSQLCLLIWLLLQFMEITGQRMLINICASYFLQCPSVFLRYLIFRLGIVNWVLTNGKYTKARKITTRPTPQKSCAWTSTLLSHCLTIMEATLKIIVCKMKIPGFLSDSVKHRFLTLPDSFLEVAVPKEPHLDSIDITEKHNVFNFYSFSWM